jgi:hypothetical protein
MLQELPIEYVLSDRERDRAVLRLLDQIELTDRQERLQGARAILYLVQVKANPALGTSQPKSRYKPAQLQVQTNPSPGTVQANPSLGTSQPSSRYKPAQVQVGRYKPTQVQVQASPSQRTSQPKSRYKPTQVNVQANPSPGTSQPKSTYKPT